jgi:signal transduction histidine kinase
MALDLRPGLVADPRSAARTGSEPLGAGRQERTRRYDLMPAAPIDNLAGEVLANRNLLAALAGPSITLTLDAEGGSLPVRLTGEDLTRILVNLIKNASEAMPEGGRILLTLRERTGPDGAVEALTLTVEDNGPGIPKKALDKIFDSGYSTRAGNDFRHDGWPASHRGLGLSITRSIVEAAGGSIHAVNRALTGARFEIELPVRSR